MLCGNILGREGKQNQSPQHLSDQKTSWLVYHRQVAQDFYCLRKQQTIHHPVDDQALSIFLLWLSIYRTNLDSSTQRFPISNQSSRGSLTRLT